MVLSERRVDIANYGDLKIIIANFLTPILPTPAINTTKAINNAHYLSPDMLGVIASAAE